MPKSRPASPPASLGVVSEAEITKFMLEREKSKRLAKEAEKLKKEVEAAEKALIKRIESGEYIDSRTYNVAVDKSSGRRNVSWKDVARGLWKGLLKDPDAEEAAVLENTPVTIYPKLAISLKG